MKSRTIFLIQLFLWLSLALTVGMPTAHAAMAQSQEIQAVQSMEDTLFAVHYDQESLNDRVSRIETTVYGQPQSGTNLEARITKLQSSLSPKALGPLSPLSKPTAVQSKQNTANNAPATANAGYSNQSGKNPQAPYSAPQQVASNNGTSANGMGNLQNQAQANYNTYKPGPKAVAAKPEPGETDYPTVSQMELKQFGKTFANEDITQRLNRLENQVFKTPQTGSLADRTDNLRLVILGDTGQGTANATAYNQSGSYGGYTGGSSSGYGQPDPQSSGYGYPQPPNYGGYGNTGGSSQPYGGPPQTAYGPPNGGYGGGSYGNYNSPNIASAAPNNGSMNPMPGYNGGGTTNVSYQPRDSANSAVTPDMLAAMNEVEKEVLGTTHPSDSINARLDRVETKVFKTTSPEMNPQDRIQRVIAVASAGGAPMNGKAKAKATFQVLLPIILTILPLVLL